MPSHGSCDRPQRAMATLYNAGQRRPGRMPLALPVANCHAVEVASSSDSPLRCPPRWLIALVAAIAVVAFLPTLGGGFLADDFAYIARFRVLPWSEWPALFMHDWSRGIWGERLRELRPFVALSFMGDARLFGGEPLGYRLTNLALHVVSTALVASLAWRYPARTSVAARSCEAPASEPGPGSGL
jgi:hypothetical protein